ncbi:GHKL domain-containing protein [Clostridium sp. 1001271B_151109_B4]|uniref:sensor histidine kinase n=1 Tax=Clostridium sp. 1001271B_151109_B4 TaxID=2787148 RepID=UPI0018AC517C|nr:GHKL domain-containing protein [Clostridium sp. 1001271B_151109_B4]
MSVIFTFIEAITMIMIYCIVFLGEKDNLAKYLLKSFIISVISTGVFFILNKIETWNIVSLLITLITISLIMSKIYNKNIIICIIQFIFTYVFVAILESIYMILSIRFLGDLYITGMYLFVVIIYFICVIYLIFRLMKNKKYNLDKFSEFISNYNNFILVIINIGIFLFLYRTLLRDSCYGQEIILETSVLFVAMILINVFYFYDVYKKDKKKKSSEIKESMNPLIQELIDEMRANEHEYKNHLNILYCMIQVCKEDELKDKAKKYIGNVFENKNLLNNLSKVENTILKAVLLSKINQAEKSEIDCYYFIDSQLEGLPLDDSELTVVLSNLLNNAIEAASKSEKKVIEISTEYYEGKHIIEVSNSVDNLTKSMVADISKIRFSTKGTGRGYGLYNVKNIVKKYKGKVNMSLEEDIFNVLIEI